MIAFVVMGGLMFPFKNLQVNHIKKGINPSSVNEIYFTGDYLLKGVKIGIVAGMIALTVGQPLFTSILNNRNTFLSICLIHSLPY